MQFENDDVKPFDITQVKGYSEQKIFKYMLPTSPSSNAKDFLAKDRLKVDVDCSDTIAVKPKKRLRLSSNHGACLQPYNKSQALNDATRMVPKLKGSSTDDIGGPQLSMLKESVPAVSLATKEVVMQKSQALTTGDQIEVLCQDSGIRGCWFRALIIKKKLEKVKVKYLDIKDAADENSNLEEWILASRVAVPDEWGLRISGRTTVRPAPVLIKNGDDNGGDALIVKDGSVVDVWRHDGWWEGIVIQKESEDNINVYFPAEKCDSVFCQKDLRPSQEWLGTGWKQMEDRQDLLTKILSKLNKKLETVTCCRSVVARDIVKDDLLAKLKWKTSRKRKRSPNSSQKLCTSETKNKSQIRAFGTRTWEKFYIPSSTKVDHENCKYTREPVFSSTVVSPLSNLVLSR
ncbi:BAH domain-containing protein [Heracleum sosnowskyi]|uniref:BAH domain-containing protein n=1 Tax=Heracleum sosnowskyi TaxID=360622 RepID=A0AAD8IJ93_9APIA|nr:BAH domain-containing protein [Heracleum sosnowskyi]